MTNKIACFCIALIFTIGISNAQTKRSTPTSTKSKPAAKSTTKSVKDSSAVANSKKAVQDDPIDDKPLRVERETKSASQNYRIIPAARSGVVMVYASSDKSTKGKEFTDWYMVKYDNQFVEQFSKPFVLDKKFELIENYFNEDTKHVYALFGENEVINLASNADGIIGKYQVYDLDLTTNNLNVIDGEIVGKMHVNVFKSIGENIYLAGGRVPEWKVMKKERTKAMFTCCIAGKKHFDVTPYLVRINTANGKAQEISVQVQQQGEVLGVDYDTIAKKTFAAVLDVPMLTQRDITIFEINDKATKTLKIPAQQGFTFLTGKLASVNENEKVIIGSYMKYDPNKKEKLSYGIDAKPSKNTSASTGFYLSKFTGTKMEYVKFYPFTKFKDMADAIAKQAKGSAKKQKAMETQINNYQLIVHNLVMRGDEMVIIADAYYKHYQVTHTTTTTTTSTAGGGSMTSYSTSDDYKFDGYMFTHALAAGFNKKGDMNWNAAFGLDNILTMNLKPQVKVLGNEDSQNIVMVYSHNGIIRSKTLSGQSFDSGTDRTAIETGSSKDKIKSSSFDDIEYWYGNYFLAYGFEKIKNSDAKNKKRLVFYLNKVVYK